MQREKRRSAIEIVRCIACDGEFKPKSRANSFCSQTCAVRARALVLAAGSTVVLTQRVCPQCSVGFVPTHGRQSFCSETCVRRKAKREFGHKHRDRARRYGVTYEPINRIKLFERDRWMCQVCGIATPRSLMGKNLSNSPEIDHRIPMAPPHGGAHTWENVQCACRRCNGHKGSKLILGQLQMFARP